MVYVIPGCRLAHAPCQRPPGGPARAGIRRDFGVAVVRALRDGDLETLLRLNNAHAVETSALSMTALKALLDAAFRVRVVEANDGGDIDAFCIALDQTAAYDNANFRWFATRHERFVYVDRIIVAEHARGRGLAQALYADLLQAARASANAEGAAHALVCCEVNVDPPNPASDRFHATFGFREAGQALLANGKTVRYLTVGV
jgi:uncharacterized protein